MKPQALLRLEYHQKLRAQRGVSSQRSIMPCLPVYYEKFRHGCHSKQRKNCHLSLSIFESIRHRSSHEPKTSFAKDIEMTDHLLGECKIEFQLVRLSLDFSNSPWESIMAPTFPKNRFRLWWPLCVRIRGSLRRNSLTALPATQQSGQKKPELICTKIPMNPIWLPQRFKTIPRRRRVKNVSVVKYKTVFDMDELEKNVTDDNR